MAEESFKHTEIRRLRYMLTKQGLFWSIDWGLEQLQAAAKSLQFETKIVNKQDSLLVTLFFELLSFDYQVAEISVVRGDPFNSESPGIFLVASPASPLIFWLPEICSGLVVVVSLAPRGRFAVPLEDLLAIDAPVETTFTLWESENSNPSKIDSVRARLRATIQHPIPVITPIGKSYSEIIASRKSVLPVISPVSLSIPTYISGSRTADISDYRSLCSPQLLSRLDRLRQRIAETERDNARLAELLSHMSR